MVIVFVSFLNNEAVLQVVHFTGTLATAFWGIYIPTQEQSR
jgi:hypothetical protein